MLLQTIEQIGREKNIPPDVIIEAVEEAMAVASKKYYKTEEDLKAKLNRETGEVEVFAVKEVVDEVEDRDLEISEARAHQFDEDAKVGDFVHIPMETEDLGRIAAQAAKQVIFQKVRDAERENIYDEFVERAGELITGLVKRFERGDMIVDLGRTEGLLPRREQSRAEHYNIGDRIRVVIVDVLKVSRGPQVVVSRVHPDLLIRLFEMEVPEIYDGTVSIKGAVREGGDRAKVAVHSSEPDVDPVGACVGMRGSRVQSIIRELRGEKIDIVQWSPDMQQYAINALKPARVNRVTVIDGEERHLEVVVDEDQLSLAIGKRGQNVRLAGKLLNAKIDIKSEEDKKREVERALAQMAVREESIEILDGVGEKTAEALVAAGIKNIGDVVDAGPEGLEAIDGIGPVGAANLLVSAKEHLDAALPEEEAEAAAEEQQEVTAEAAAEEEQEVTAEAAAEEEQEVTAEAAAEEEQETTVEAPAAEEEAPAAEETEQIEAAVEVDEDVRAAAEQELEETEAVAEDETTAEEPADTDEEEVVEASA
ncbi:MAG: transcription termination factor NusA [Acidobacteriota bacterium]|jgi:N utilization substance protein A